MSIESKIYSAIAHSLRIELDVSAHAVIRYVERMLKKDVTLLFLKDRQRRYRACSKIPNYKVDDQHLIVFLKNNYKEEYEIAVDHLKYMTRGKVSDFTDEGIRYIIRDLNLITVF